MFASGTHKKNQLAPGLVMDGSDAQIIGRMRLVLAVSMLLTAVIDPPNVIDLNRFIWLIFSGYVAHSIILYIYSQHDKPFSQSKLIHWLDVGWFTLIVLFTGGIDSHFFYFFFFAILTSSFRWGFEEGARVTIASAALFAVCALALEENVDLPRLLLRTTFLLALGYMSAHWGESKLGLKRRLALLRDVSRISNPRFGVDHTITNVLGKTQEFFRSNSCILVMQHKESAACSLRTIKQGDPKQSIHAERISAEAASPFMALPQHQTVVYSMPHRLAMFCRGGFLAYDHADTRWMRDDGQRGEILAELLGAHSFISAPVSLRREEGRIYVISRKSKFSKADALFLHHISTQAFPVIESIDLLDRMASEAALLERGKIALDLHDTAVQPYIGLNLGLSAVRKKASADNPLVEDLDKLMEMTSDIIDDLRRYAGTFKAGTREIAPILLSDLHQQAAQVKEFYGVDIVVSMEGEHHMNDRLAAEVLHVVREGLSNICKHTLARRGFVRLRCFNGWLRIQIESDGAGPQAIDFQPRSITERAAALGGWAHVTLGASGGAAVHVEIPI